MMEDSIRQTNADLAGDSQMGGSQIRRFLILHKELDPDDGEMTRTRKVRRNIIRDKYGVLVDALYEGLESCHIRTEVTFEDGRKGALEADLSIRDVEVFPTVAKSA